LKKNKSQSVFILVVIIFSVVIVGLTVFMTLKNTSDLSAILEESIKSELISTSIAAREHLDIDRFDSYNSLDDIYDDFEAYSETLRSLRNLKNRIGVEYIYALKHLNGKYYFIFDTDEEIDTLFDEYEISYVHERAFLGFDYAGVMNVADEYGSFNTGAVPLWKNGKVIGIISTDIADEYIQESRDASTRNAIILIAAMLIIMGGLTVLVWFLMRNVRKMQDKLYDMANIDVLTGLPNRQFLITYLEEVAEKAIKQDEPFAFLLMDIDNFKRVNDGAGHDAGDELLRHFAVYLNTFLENSRAFRPPAGALNVSARIGGDEFVQIVPGVRTEDEAQMVAKKVLDNFSSQTIDRFVERYQVGLSIGVALFPFHTDNFNVLIKYADVAMYYAKRSGKNSYRLYSEDMVMIEPEERALPDGKSSADRRQYRV